MKFRARRALSLPMLAVIAALCVVLLGAPGAASAKTVGPFYNPHTKSYFALVELGTMSGKSWDRAAQLASTRSYKGVHGRLAVVDDVQTHMWLQEKFKAEMDKDAWIGLRYFCNARKLMWVDGEIMDESPPGVWHPRVGTERISCAARSG